MATDTDASSDATDDEPSVAATCRTCGDHHPLGDREAGATTTTCPACGDTSYVSEAVGDATVKPDDERIADAVRDIRGVGAQTQANIVAAFPTYYDFVAASEARLRDIDGVGRETAARITRR